PTARMPPAIGDTDAPNAGRCAWPPATTRCSPAPGKSSGCAATPAASTVYAPAKKSSTASSAWTRNRPARHTSTTTREGTGPSTSDHQTAPVSSQQIDPSATIGQEGLLRLVKVVERLRARGSETSVSSWTTTEASAPDAGCGYAVATLARVTGGQSPG